MKFEVLAIGFALSVAGSGICQAGVIHFHGAIVEPACSVQANAGARVDLTGCPPAGRGVDVVAQPLSSVTALGGSAVRVRLMAHNSPTERYFDRQYQLLNEAGQPLRSGDYGVTLSMP